MKCPNEGTLQAYLDGEQAGAADHLQVCAACRARLARLEATAARVNAWMDALGDGEVCEAGYSSPVLKSLPANGVRWGWAAIALAAAASIALFFATAPARKKPGAPVVQAKVTPSVAPAVPVVTPRKPVARTARRIRRPPKPLPSRNDDFVALDDGEPMQMGMVVRVMLPVTDVSLTGGPQEVAADLAIGEDGRPRAFRLVR
jgi:anti-sigma factor RsiW